MGDYFAEQVARMVERCEASVYVAPEGTVRAGEFRFDAEALRENFAAVVALLNTVPARQLLALAEALTPKEVGP